MMNNMAFILNLEKHEYTLDGEILPSVTQIISPLSNYSRVNPDILERARLYGTAVHEMIRLWLQNKLDEASLDGQLRPALESFQNWYYDGQFAKDIDECGIICEEPRYHSTLRYAGTPDLIIDSIVIIDIKTRQCNPFIDSLQLAAYENLHLANDGSKADYKRIVLQLEECPITGSKYKETDVYHKKAWPMCRAMLDRYYREQEFTKKIEGWRRTWK